jgi:hypothetical protein
MVDDTNGAKKIVFGLCIVKGRFHLPQIVQAAPCGGNAAASSGNPEAMLFVPILDR